MGWWNYLRRRESAKGKTADVHLRTSARLMPDVGVPLILIVDDHAASRRLLVAVLSRDYRVECASDGREGIAKALELQPDLIISDVRMPNMPGDRMVEEIRKHPDLEDTPIILVTANSDEAIRYGPLRSHVQDFLGKPFEPREILARTERLLSDRRRNAASIRQAYTLMRAVLNGTNDCIFAKDLEGRFLMLNAAAAENLGSTVDAVLGKDEGEFVSARVAAKIRAEEAAVLESGVPWTSEQEVRTPKGMRTYLTTKTLHHDPQGRVAGLIGVQRDISETKRAQNEHFRQVVETASDAFISIDNDGTITQWNRQAETLMGWSPQEAIGLPVIETIFPARLRAAYKRDWTRYLTKGSMAAERRSNDIFVLHRDGQEIPVEISLWPVTVEGKTHFNAFLRDNRERLRQAALLKKNLDLEAANRRAAEASRLKSQFVANMSHELRTPLNAIIGFAELLADGKAGAVSPMQSEFLGDLQASSRHLLALINSVLDLAKVESGKMEFRAVPVDLAGLAAEVCEVIRPLAAKKRVQLEMEVDPALTDVTADPMRLKQVLYNYLSNAVKFTSEQGSVSLRITAEEGGQFRMAVKDTGIGISAENQRSLFVEFQQLDHGTTKQFQGTGLGLSLTKRIVEAQGGFVGCISKVGEGSTFFAVLPRRAIDNATAAPPG